MKIILERIHEGEDEIIIRYSEKTKTIDELLSKLDLLDAKLSGTSESGNQTVIFSVSEALYFESVDGKLFAYCKEQVLQISERLEDICKRFSLLGMVQCSRTMVINLYKVEHLESLQGAKIMATMQNSEKVLISRKYAGAVKAYLQRGGRG